ncbi:MAG: hypothetical protein KUG77_02880 [Nannocystaceae bacterium]|nr:hypothetical protein [Nannocystaceae bacterium]
MRKTMLIALGVLAPQFAHASNGAGQRTPPIYPLAACIAEVDRSIDPVFHLDIGLPREDFMVTDDEPEDSRRLQFFLVCEDVHPELRNLPNWVTVGEAEDALARGSIETMPSDDDILERREDLQRCVFPMNPSGQRIPITCDATQAGVDFDTRDIPAGNYVVRGYTYEPPLNLWSERRGVVRISDDAESGPATVGLRTPSLDGVQLRPGSPFPIRGCASGTSEVVLQWASLINLGGDDDAGAWQTLATLAGPGSFEIEFDPPADAVGQPLLIRGVAGPETDVPWIDHAEGTFLVFGDGGDSDEPFGEPAEICGFYDPTVEPEMPDTTGGGTGGELTETDGEMPGGSEDSGRAGCACASAQRGARGGRQAGWLLLGLLGARRRRRTRR